MQAHDLSMDQLRHRRDSLPDRLVLAGHEAALARLDRELQAVRDRVADLGRSQRRLEDEIASIEDKATQTDRRLYSGTVNVPRELQSLQDELEGLRRRARSLEDDLLDVMEAAEPVTAEVERLEGVRDEHESEVDRLRSSLADEERDLDAEIAAARAERADAAASVPADLLATYEQLRSRLGGVGVARLESGRCTGCHLALPATELDALRRAGDATVVRHEECGRILVH